jgi:Flp pilus assembly protein TadG
MGKAVSDPKRILGQILGQILRGFLRETRSVTAVEFGIIAPVLFLFVFLILLTGIVQFWQLTLDDSVRNAARQIGIGAGSSSSGIHSASDFVTSVCGEFGQAAPNCSANLQFAVQGAANFTGSGGITPATINTAGQLSLNATFSGITIGQPFLVQAVYPVPISIPLVPVGLVTLNGKPSIISAAAMVAEP